MPAKWARYQKIHWKRMETLFLDLSDLTRRNPTQPDSADQSSNHPHQSTDFQGRSINKQRNKWSPSTLIGPIVAEKNAKWSNLCLRPSIIYHPLFQLSTMTHHTASAWNSCRKRCSPFPSCSLSPTSTWWVNTLSESHISRSKFDPVKSEVYDYVVGWCMVHGSPRSVLDEMGLGLYQMNGGGHGLLGRYQGEQYLVGMEGFRFDSIRYASTFSTVSFTGV